MLLLSLLLLFVDVVDAVGVRVDDVVGDCAIVCSHALFLVLRCSSCCC